MRIIRITIFYVLARCDLHTAIGLILNKKALALNQQTKISTLNTSNLVSLLNQYIVGLYAHIKGILYVTSPGFCLFPSPVGILPYCEGRLNARRSHSFYDDVVTKRPWSIDY